MRFKNRLGLMTAAAAAAALFASAPLLSVYAGAETFPEQVEASFVSGTFEAPTSGKFGDLNWKYESNTITITGSAAMESMYYADEYPWYKYSEYASKIVIGDYVTSVSENAFQNFKFVNSLKLGARLKTIGIGAFENLSVNCEEPTDITIPKSLKSVGDRAFSGARIELDFEAASVLQTIGDYAFSESSIEEDITIPKSVTVIGEGAFCKAKNLRHVNFETGSVLNSIGANAFSDMPLLSYIYLPDSLLNIGNKAFMNDEKLVNVKCGSQLRTIGDSAFEGCNKLRDLSWGNDLKTIGNRAFFHCTALTGEVKLPYGTSSIGNMAFCGTNISGTLIIPSTVTKLGSSAFSGCKSLTKLELGCRGEVEGGCFSSCSNLADVKIANTVTGLGNNCFESSGLTSVTVPDSVTSFGKNVFGSCKQMKSVTIGNGVTEIPSNTFFDCTTLTDVSLPDGITKIGSSAFENTKITTFVGGPALKSIGTFVFCGSSVGTVILDKLEDIDSKAFCDCPSLRKVYIYDDEFTYSDNPKIKGLVFEYETEVYLLGNTKNVLYTARGTGTASNEYVNPKPITSIYNPTNVKATVQNNKVLVSWKYAVGAALYDVYRAPTAKGPFTLVGSTSGTVLTDTVLPALNGRTFYRIQAHRGDIYSTYSETATCLYLLKSLEKPKITKSADIVQGIRIYWNPIKDAARYDVYRSDSEDGTYVMIGKTTATNYADGGVASGKTYYYRVVAGHSNIVSEPSDTKKVIFVGTPDITGRVNKSAGISLTWQKITGAAGYAVYRKTTGSWERIATISGNTTFTYLDTDVAQTNGVVYHYTVRAICSDNTLSGCHSNGRTMVRLLTPTVKITKTGKPKTETQLKVNWNTNSKAGGYEVRIMQGTEIVNSWKISDNTIIEKEIGNLDAGTYKIQVRSYIDTNDAGTYYSAWSAENMITIES